MRSRRSKGSPTPLARRGGPGNGGSLEPRPGPPGLECAANRPRGIERRRRARASLPAVDRALRGRCRRRGGQPRGSRQPAGRRGGDGAGRSRPDRDPARADGRRRGYARADGRRAALPADRGQPDRAARGSRCGGDARARDADQSRSLHAAGAGARNLLGREGRRQAGGHGRAADARARLRRAQRPLHPSGVPRARARQAARFASSRARFPRAARPRSCTLLRRTRRPSRSTRRSASGCGARSNLRVVRRGG